MEQWKNVEIQGLRFGEGLPKVCVPLTGQGVPALLSEMQAVSALPADLYEWRLDCFFGDPLPTLPTVVRELGGRPLLCTKSLRTCCAAPVHWRLWPRWAFCSAAPRCWAGRRPW